MVQRWICMNGHGMAEAPHAYRCPICATEVRARVLVGPAGGHEADFPHTLLPGMAPLAATGEATLVPPTDGAPTQPLRPKAATLAQEPDFPHTLLPGMAPLTATGEATLVPPSMPGPQSPLRPPSEIEVTLQPPASVFPPATPTNARHAAPLTGQQPPMNDAPTLVPLGAPTASHGTGPVILPDYEILEVLGRGGMGVVYKARQKALGRVVALKMILAGQHASDDELRRFQTEAEAVARLQHPNIVAIHDIGTRDGRPYFSLEYCDGGSLQSRLDGSPLPPAHAADLLRKLAEAVGYAHGKGIIHRDLKPANVLLVEDKKTPLERATPKITDFGLAKRMEDDQGQTATEAILGTPTYMAPEQAQGKTKTVGPPADVYALGAILYDLLTGRPPFKGATAMDTIQMVQTAEPVPPVRLQPGIPGDLQTITLKCLEKQPERRYATAGDLAADLTRFLSGQPILARPVSAWERAWKYVKRNPLAAAFIALCFLAPLAVAGVSLGYSFHLDEQRRIAVKAKEDAEASETKAKTAEKAAKDAKLVAESEAAKAKKEKENAEKAEKRAKSSEAEAVDYLGKAQRAADRLLRVAQTRLRDMGGTEAARRELLAEGLKLSKQFLAHRTAALPDQLRGAQAAALVGELEAQVGNDKQAIGHFDDALACFDSVLAQSAKHRADASFQNQAVEVCLLRWASQEAVEPAKSRESLDAALARIAKMPAEVRDDPTTKRSRAIVLHTRALHDQSRGGDPLPDLAESLKILEGLEASDANLLEKARILSNRAGYQTAAAARQWSAMAKRMRLASAAESGDKAIELLTDVRKRDRRVEVLAALGQALGNNGLLLLSLGKADEAAKVFDGAVAEFRDVRRRAPLNADYRHLLAGALISQGIGKQQAGRAADAEGPLTEAIQLLDDLTEQNPESKLYRADLARAQAARGNAYEARGKYTEAIDWLTKARAGFLDAATSRGDAQSREDGWAAWSNLVRCRDRLARQADAKGDKGEALKQLDALASLRRERLEYLKPSPGEWAKAVPFALAATELLSTQDVRADFLEKAGDHRALAEAVEEMALLAPKWSGQAANLKRLEKCIELAKKEGDESAAKKYEERRRALERAR